MEIKTYTIISTGNKHEEGFEILCEGYDREKACWNALRALMYACCHDFSDLTTMITGHYAGQLEAEGVLMGEDDDEDDICVAMGWDRSMSALVLEYDGQRIAFEPDVVYGNISRVCSEEIVERVLEACKNGEDLDEDTICNLF